MTVSPFDMIAPSPRPICIGCGKHPADLSEYIAAVEADPDYFTDPDDYVKRKEGTYNPSNGHFLCTPCYVKAGRPTSPHRWRAP